MPKKGTFKPCLPKMFPQSILRIWSWFCTTPRKIKTLENCPLTFKCNILCETVGIFEKVKEEFGNFLHGKTCLNPSNY